MHLPAAQRLGGGLLSMLCCAVDGGTARAQCQRPKLMMPWPAGRYSPSPHCSSPAALCGLKSSMAALLHSDCVLCSGVRHTVLPRSALAPPCCSPAGTLSALGLWAGTVVLGLALFALVLLPAALYLVTG